MDFKAISNMLLEIFYIIIGIMMLNTALLTLKDKNHKAKIGTTLFWALLGFIFMAYILKNMSTLIIFRDRFLYNTLVLIISLSIIFGFNILVGLIPVFNTIRKSPAQILSRTDID